MPHNQDAPLFDRLIAAGSYLTLGTVGMVWFLLSVLFLKKPMTKFLAYNLIQSFVLSIVFAIFSLAYNIFIGIFVSLPFVGKFFLAAHIFLFETPVFNTFSFVNYVIFLFICYLSILSIFGALPFIPYITGIVKKLWR